MIRALIVGHTLGLFVRGGKHLYSALRMTRSVCEPGIEKNFKMWDQTLLTWISLLVLCGLLLVGKTIHAQSDANTGTICALTFNDLAKNGIRVPGDPPLSGVNVTLAIDNGLMIANHLSDDQGQYCFTNLVPGRYRLTFSDPLAQPTTPTILTLTVSGGDHLINLFGAVPDIASDSPAVDPTANAPVGIVVSLTRSGRLVLSAIGALLVMVAMLGIGLFAYGLYRMFKPKPRRGGKSQRGVPAV